MGREVDKAMVQVTVVVQLSINMDMIGGTGMVDSFNVSLSASFITKKIFLMKLALSETLKLSTIPVLPIMSLFNQFSTRSVNKHRYIQNFCCCLSDTKC